MHAMVFIKDCSTQHLPVHISVAKDYTDTANMHMEISISDISCAAG